MVILEHLVIRTLIHRDIGLYKIAYEENLRDPFSKALPEKHVTRGYLAYFRVSESWLGLCSRSKTNCNFI